METLTEPIPSGVNFNRLKKSEIVWLFNHFCKHKHRYTEHPTCFLEEYKDRLATMERVGFLDIEATNLNADFGYILCYSLKELNGALVHCSVTPRDIRSYKFDKRVMGQFLKDIQPFDRLVGYYSKDYRYDIPMLRSRSLFWDLNFPEWKDYLFTDVYDLAKGKLKLHRTRLETVCDFFGIPSKEHRLNPEVWQRAQAGSKRALDYIQIHCDEDVLSLEAVYKRLNTFGRQSKLSI
jgi:uncharacterized protein YprB with RNaseH-like and TPR domain